MALPTELCLAKAAYLAHHSTEAAASIRVGMIFLLTLLNTPLVLGAIIGIVSAESRPPSREHIKLPERLRGLVRIGSAVQGFIPLSTTTEC